jgi:serine protein kinase
MRVYNGESLKEVDPKARTLQEYKDAAGVDEGHGRHLDALCVQGAGRDLQSRHTEVAADPVHLMYVLEQRIAASNIPEQRRALCWNSSRADLAPRYAEFIGNEIQKAYLESYHDYGQNLFDRYVDYADAGSRTSTSRIPTRASCSIANCSTRSFRRSKSQPVSPTRRISATRS